MSLPDRFEDRLTRALRDTGALLADTQEPDPEPGLFDPPQPRARPGKPPGLPEPGAVPSPDLIEAALRAVDESIWRDFEYALRAEPSPEREAAAWATRAIREGPAAALDRSRAPAPAVLLAAYRVRREIDRFRGLLRFAPDSWGVLTAVFEPDNDILDILGRHFLRRFGAEPFRIVDLRRETEIASRGGRIVRIEAPWPPSADTEARASGSRRGFGDSEDLWRAYYRAAENPSRSNPRLRLRFLPRRYWKHLPELGQGAEET